MFRNGDYVVIPSGEFNWLYRVYYLCTQNRVMLYKHDKWCKDTAFQSWPHINLVRHATPEEIAAGHRIDNGKCPHGYDLACLLCGFGTVDGHRVYHPWAKERPISRKRARKLRKRHGVSVYFSKRLECLVWVKTA